MGHYVSLINGMSNAQADDFMSFATDLLDGNSGIVASGDYAVAQSSPVAMSVTVATGKAYIYISSLLSYYRTILDAAATLSIASNSSGSTRIDLICIKIDTGATPDANASNVASVVVVQGTPGGGAPATPANHYKLAEVTVASGAATIVTANIADSRSQIGVRSGVKVVEASLSFADNTTADASTTKHGLLKKLSNVATEFMNGVGSWVTAVTLDAAQTLTNKTLTDPIIGNKYKFSAYRSAALNSPNGTGAMVAYDAENFDSNNDFDISTNKGRYTVPVNGFYFFCATISHSANIRTILSLARNGSAVLRGSDLTATNGAHTVQVSGILNLSAGNYVEVEVWTASSTAYYVGSNTCNFHGFLVCRT